jgi:hypothetical protein
MNTKPRTKFKSFPDTVNQNILLYVTKELNTDLPVSEEDRRKYLLWL